MRTQKILSVVILSFAISVIVNAQNKTDDINKLLQPLESAIAALRTTLIGPPAPVAPVATSKRVEAVQLVYDHAFRLPGGSSNGDSFAFGGAPVTFGVTTQTLFVGARSGAIAEVTLPASGQSTYIQGFAEPSEGEIKAAFGNLAGLTGLLTLQDGRLLGDALIYYDAGNIQRVSHFIRPRDLKDLGHTSPLATVGSDTMVGYTAGYLAQIPAEWQTALKGTVISGTFGSPIVTRGSLGPTAFSFNPDTKAMPAIGLVYYPSDHATLGAYGTGTANPVYNMTAKADALVIIDGSALFIGRSGLGIQKYGAGTGNQALEGTIESGSDTWVYDPTDSSKGTHAYPYRYQIWAYDLNDFAAVAAGSKKPWDVVPYGIWPLELPTIDVAFSGIGGAVFDPVSRLLYVSQLRADIDGYEYRAMMHAFKVNAAR